MIQTDKPKYKPGDSVRMRIFFIRPDRRAVDGTEINNYYMEIRNRFDEKVCTFFVAVFTPKVYTHTYQLINEAFEGDYSIYVWTNVPTNDNEEIDNEDDGRDLDKSKSKKSGRDSDEDVNDDTSEKKLDVSNIKLDVKDAISQHFTVEKYVLTEFTLDVETNRIVRPFSTFHLKISGSYSFGKHVIGNAIVTAKIIHDNREMRNYQTSAKVGSNGETYAIVSISTENHLHLKNSIETYDVDIKVLFIDDLSKQKIEKELKVTIATTDTVKLILDPAEGFLRPGTMFTMKAHLKDIDGKLIEKTNKEVFMSVTKKYQLGVCDYPSAGNSRLESYAKVGSEKISESVASFEVYVPYNTTSLKFKASYEGAHAEFEVARTPDVPVSRHYVSILTDKDM